MVTLPRFLSTALAAFFLTILTGCDTTAPAAQRVALASVAGVRYDPDTPLDATLSPLGGEEVRCYNVRYRGAGGESVPGLLALPAPKGERAPCVLLLHGLGGSKGNMFLPALLLAKRGYATFAIDIAGHGERPRIGGKDPASLTLPEMRRAAAQTVQDLRRAVDFLQTRPEIDAARIGFIGLSLGGILGGVFAAEEPRVKAAALWSAGGDWGRLVTLSTHPFARRLREHGAKDAARVEAQMEAVDPARVAARIAPRPLLMINGDADTIVPHACTQALYDAARQPKRLVLLPGGHVPDMAAMLDRTSSWLDATMK